MIAKKKNRSNLIKILCVLLGAVFAFTTSIVYGAFSWTRTHNSGYATGMYLPNQSYQIINDTLPNGIPFSDGVKEYEIALEYSYDYNFKFYVEYNLSWTNSSLDTSNVILNFSNRDAWIVDNNRIYYKDVVAKGTGTLPIIVGVDFVDCYNETYFGQALKINITDVKIVRENASLDTTGIAGTAWQEYQERKLSSYAGTDAYVVVYNQTDKGTYKPKAPVGKTAFRSGSVVEMTENEKTITQTTTTIKKIFGNKNYVGVGAYIITGASAVNIKARAVGYWQPDTGTTSSAGDVHIVSNTIKYNFAENWGDETYPADTEVQEVRTYAYSIPAHTAVYVDILDSVEVVSRGYYANADYSGFHISTTINLNEQGNITTTNGIGTTTITSISATTTEMPTNTFSVINSSKYDAGLYQATSDGSETYKTQVRVVNNTANKLSISASYSLKIYISNGNSTAAYGGIYSFEDTTYWARDIVTEGTSSYVTIPEAGVLNSGQYIAPYSAMTICTSFQINNGVNTWLKGVKSAYEGSDIWVELVPTITATTTTVDDSQLALETEVSSNTAKFYVKNLSTNVLSSISLSINYSSYNNQSGMTEFNSNGQSTAPTNWERNYWKYYVKDGTLYKQNTNSTWNSGTTYYVFAGWQTQSSPTNKTLSAQINPGEKVLVGSLTLNSSQIYDFSRYTLTGSVDATATDVQMINETTGNAYLINNSTTKSYYVRFAGSTTLDYFFANGGYAYFKGLIRPGQVIPVTITATDTAISASVIEDTSGVLLTEAELSNAGWPTAVLANYKALYN